MYICALFSGACYGWWNEQLNSERAFVDALKHLAKANGPGHAAPSSNYRPDAIFMQSESTEYFHPGNPAAIAPARK